MPFNILIFLTLWYTIPMSYAAQLCDFLTLPVCGISAKSLISMLLNYNIFCLFGSRYFLKTYCGQRILIYSPTLPINLFSQVGQSYPKTRGNFAHPYLKKLKIWKVAKTQIVCSLLVPVSACILKTITHLYYNCSWNYLSSNL